MLFLTNARSSKCNTFLCVLTEELIYGTILLIKGHLQGENVNVKAKWAKMW